MEFTFSTASQETIADLQAKLDAEAAAGGFHGYVTLTGRVFLDTTDNTTWYEIDLQQPAPHEQTAWVSWEAELDPHAPLAETETAITGWCEPDLLFDPTRF